MAVSPQRGQIWFAALPTDPDKERPVLVVSADARNRNPNAGTVIVVPLTTNPAESPTRLRLTPGETGLAETCSMAAEDITVLAKSWLVPPRLAFRNLSEARLREVARGVLRALGFPEGAVS
jgi:mRNA-degrading endonuclease toxin of MazEF toxin-antitoxin module